MLAQVQWFGRLGMERFDLAVSLAPDNSGGMIWHRNITADRLTALRPFAAARNTAGANIYVRPARGFRWPVVLVDDIARDCAERIRRAYACCVLETSAGNYQAWIACAHPLDEAQRLTCQRHIASRVGADLGSVSGEHLGRLAGYTNRKPGRGGHWVRVHAIGNGRAWDPSRILAAAPADPPPLHPPQGGAVVRRGVLRDESADEWGYVCGRLSWLRDSHASAARITDELKALTAQLERRATARKHPKPIRYAQRTIAGACHRIGI